MQWSGGIASLAALLVLSSSLIAQSAGHGRKWKPLPPTAHIVVTVVKGFNGKPFPNAAVIFHAERNGRDDGNLEVKTDPEGKAAIDVIEIGSKVNVQVIADGFATYAHVLDVDGPNEELEVKLARPKAQVSTYSDIEGKTPQIKPGVQEPAHIIPPQKPSTLTGAPQ